MTPRDYAFCLAWAILFLVSCSPTRHLSENERLLVDVELKGLQQVNPEEVEQMYRQTPNIKIPLLNFYPQLEVYYFGKMFYRPDKIQQRIARAQQQYQERIQRAGRDSLRVTRLTEQRNEKIERMQTALKQGNFLMRKVGEPPAIYDSALTKKTVEQIGILLDSKGYFQNAVTYTERFRKKRAYITYEVKEGAPYLYDRIRNIIPDTAVARLVASARNKSHIAQGQNYDEKKLEQERDRLTLLLRNNGYYYFDRQLIYFNVDTSFGGNTVRPQTVIENPAGRPGHQVYTLRNVYVITDASANRFGISRDTVVYHGIHFLAYNHQFRPRALTRKIRLEPGQGYSYDFTLRTQRQLTDLQVFRFANVTYRPVADSGSHQLNAFITAHPIERFQLSNQLGLSLREQLPGPFFNLRLMMRNVTGGAELLEFGVRGGLEGVISRATNERQYSQEVGANLALTVPRFVLPVSRYDFFSRNAPRTRFNISQTYINRPDYERTNFEFSMQYIWRSKQYRQFIISPFEINLINTQRLEDDFRDALINTSRGEILLRSFRSNFVSAMNFTYLYNDNDLAQTRNATFFRGFFEVGGLFKSLTENLIYPKLSRFQYAKAEADYRRYVPQAPERLIAYRVHGGVAHPFGPVKSVPYEEYFFAGGGSSIRAWRPRRLGPGSYTLPPPTQDEQRLEPEQPGEVIIESSVEYRFPVFGFIKGALFVDAGNIWTISPDITAERQGSEFGKNFYREFGVGTGLGIRFDFTFLILRFDMGSKVYDPSKDKDDRFVLDNFTFKRDKKDAYRNSQRNRPVINFGIGYPF